MTNPERAKEPDAPIPRPHAGRNSGSRKDGDLRVSIASALSSPILLAKRVFTLPKMGALMKQIRAFWLINISLARLKIPQNSLHVKNFR